ELRESSVESGERVVALVERGLEDWRALANLPERRRQSPRPAVGLEGHPVRVVEPPAHPPRLDALGADLGIREAPGGVGIRRREQRAEPGGWGPGRLAGAGTEDGPGGREGGGLGGWQR